jgi:hypothetical protein
MKRMDKAILKAKGHHTDVSSSRFDDYEGNDILEISKVPSFSKNCPSRTKSHKVKKMQYNALVSKQANVPQMQRLILEEYWQLSTHF